MVNYKVFLSENDVDHILTTLSVRKVELERATLEVRRTINSVKKQAINQVPA